MYRELYGPEGWAIFDHPYNGGQARVLVCLAYRTQSWVNLREAVGIQGEVTGPAGEAARHSRYS